MKLLVNIRGCNGAGKSTIPMSMLDDPDMYVIEKPFEKGKKPRGIATVFPNYGWVALGTYKNKTGGMDIFPNNQATEKVLKYVLKNFPEYDILMEGIMASTIFSTYAELFNKIEKKYPERAILIVSFVPPLQVCLDRIQLRNGGKPIKEDAVKQKWRIVTRNVDKFKNAGFTSIKIDNSNTSNDKMLSKFLKLVEKYRGDIK